MGGITKQSETPGTPREMEDELAAEGSALLKLTHVRLSPRSVEALHIDPIAARHVVNGPAGATHRKPVIEGAPHFQFLGLSGEHRDHATPRCFLLVRRGRDSPLVPVSWVGRVLYKTSVPNLLAHALDGRKHLCKAKSPLVRCWEDDHTRLCRQPSESTLAQELPRGVRFPPVSPTSVLSMCNCKLTRQDTALTTWRN